MSDDKIALDSSIHVCSLGKRLSIKYVTLFLTCYYPFPDTESYKSRSPNYSVPHFQTKQIFNYFNWTFKIDLQWLICKSEFLKLFTY